MCENYEMTASLCNNVLKYEEEEGRRKEGRKEEGAKEKAEPSHGGEEKGSLAIVAGDEWEEVGG